MIVTGITGVGDEELAAAVEEKVTGEGEWCGPGGRGEGVTEEERRTLF